MATKIYKVVTYHEELSLLEVIDPFITWCFEVKWHIECVIFSIAPDHDLQTWQRDNWLWEVSTHKFT